MNVYVGVLEKRNEYVLEITRREQTNMCVCVGNLG
jgi:hypothetical protein